MLHERELHRYQGKSPHSSFVQSTDRVTRLSDTLWIRTIPFLKDNYSYLIADENSRIACVIDPGDAKAVMSALEEENQTRDEDAKLSLQMILCTHKHADHTGGNAELVKLFPKIIVVGGQLDQIPFVTRRVKQDDEIVLVCPLSSSSWLLLGVCVYIQLKLG